MRLFLVLQNVVCLQDMQVLSKVEAGLNFNQVLLKPESKNFTQVATLACKSNDYVLFNVFLSKIIFFVVKQLKADYLCYYQVHCQAMGRNAQVISL